MADSITEKVVWYVVKEFSSKAHLGNFAPHDLRRTCARLCHLAGGELEQIEGISVPIGDVITEVEGDPVSSSDDVIEVVNSVKPGDKLGMSVVTPGENERHVEVTVGTRPEGV